MSENPAVKVGDEVVVRGVVSSCPECVSAIGTTLAVACIAGAGSVYCKTSTADGDTHRIIVTRWTLPEPAWTPAANDEVEVTFRGMVGNTGHPTMFRVRDGETGVYAWVRPEHLTLIAPATPPEPEKRPGQVWEDAQGRRMFVSAPFYTEDDRFWLVVESETRGEWFRDSQIARPIKLILDAPDGAR